ncbi:E3 ubiquitin-protein ligase RNF183 [Rhinophrynus dorsalis]
MAQLGNLDPERDCPVCWNPYNATFRIPKILDCHHFFCMECLAHLCQAAQIRNRLQCPLCRHTTILQIYQQISDLPTNAAILSQLKGEPPSQDTSLPARDTCTLALFQRPPSVYTVNVGMESNSLSDSRTPLTTIPSDDSLWQCLYNPQYRMFTYLMVLILTVTVFLIFSIFWTRKFIWGPG